MSNHDITTSEGGRAYIREFFATKLRRHDFGSYITQFLAADFACALAKYLSEALPARDDVQQKAIDCGFKYWRAPDAHGVTATNAQAVELLQHLLGVEVEIEATPSAPAVDGARDEAQWEALAERHANRDWNGDAYLESVKALCVDYSRAALSAKGDA